MLFHTKSGHHIYYEVHGKAMVCFHGNGQSVSYFKPQLPLAAAFQLILIDTPGHGQSSPLKEKLTFAAIATEVKELLDSLDLEDYVLVGHSDGANLAIAKHYDKGRLITLPYMGHNVNKKPEVFNDVITQLMRDVVGENIKK